MSREISLDLASNNTFRIEENYCIGYILNCETALLKCVWRLHNNWLFVGLPFLSLHLHVAGIFRELLPVFQLTKPPYKYMSL